MERLLGANVMAMPGGWGLELLPGTKQPPALPGGEGEAREIFLYLRLRKDSQPKVFLGQMTYFGVVDTEPFHSKPSLKAGQSQKCQCYLCGFLRH